ncbi:MAG: M3 family metallopeptidase [Bdellovibrionia bacterium]
MFLSSALFLSGCNSSSIGPSPASVGSGDTQRSAPPSGVSVNEPAQAPVLVRSDFKKGELTQACQAAMDKAKARLDVVAATAPQDRNFDNTVLAVESITADLADETNPLTFMGYVSTNADTRSEGSECEGSVGDFGIEISTRRDLYDALKDQKPRNADETRLLSETLKAFERNGLKLPEDKLAQVKALQQKLTAVQTQFNANLNNDVTTVELTEAELAGVPADYKSNLKKTADGARYIVTTRESDVGSFMANATNSEARRKWLFGYYNRGGKANTELLEQAISLRQQIAKLMGYSTWADYRIQGRMAKDAKTVLDFLNGLKTKLAERDREDIAGLLKFKKELDPSATEVNAWDINFLQNQIKKRDYSLDDEKIREYFPADVVISGMFDVYSKLLGVHYTEIADAPVWSPDVKLYRINDNKDDRLIGYFYTDFVPRPYKYGHAAAFPQISGRVLPNGSYSLPVAAIVANLAAPANGKPSLLSHDDVETIFHEFGHIMHMTLTRAPYASLSGSNVAQDFVEAPSQMLENWVWDADVLSRISGHYLDHSQKLPADLLQKMIAARDFDQAYYYTRQLMLALTDMDYHTADGAVDTAAIYNRNYEEMIGVKPVAGAHFAGTFGHLMGGYDAGYYGYLWSLVYATDMFTRFHDGGMLSPEVGADYRRVILENGNSKDAIDLLGEFLGRTPNSEAFFKKLHI